MENRRIFGLIGIYLFLSSISFAGVPTLNERILNERTLPGLGFTEQLKADLATKHVVWVDGIMNELALITGNYFSDNIKEIKKLGMKKYTHQRFSSRKSIPYN